MNRIFELAALLIMASGMLAFAQGDPAGTPPGNRTRMREGKWWVRPVVERAGLRPGHVRPHSWIQEELVEPLAVSPSLVRTGPGGFWPSDIQTAYDISGIPGLPLLPSGLTAGGAGITVAVVDAYDAPNALEDLNAFSTQYDLPPFNSISDSPCAPTFSKVSQSGTSTLPRTNSSWEVEISLDIQWVHAVAPCANILLVEATSSNNSNLLAALTYASAHASVVSMSWGSSEFRGEATYDVYFQIPDVTFLASAGDKGGLVEWPSVASGVIAVGGTNLPAHSTNGGLGAGDETAWSGSGGGCTTRQEPQPTVQTVINFPTPCEGRGVPDVAASGGPDSAVSVYVSGQGGWKRVYGTSLSCPMWAALIAVADGMRAESGKVPLSSETLADLYYAYTNSAADYFTDIVSGTAGTKSAGAGWDFVTGMGSPKASALIPYLATAP